MEKIDGVIVVGAGPVGFLTALGLAQAGIRVTLLEAEPGINDAPRAAIYFPTTLDVLEQLGILDDANAIGLQSHTFCYRVPQSGTAITVDVRTTMRPNERHPYNLHFGQHILARLVLDHLRRLPNAEVRWSHRVVSVTPDAQGVTVGVQSPRGPEELRADWLVGADGARSAVRQLVGLPFEGHTWPDRFVATNVRFDFAKYGYEPANVVSDPVHWAVVARLGRENLWRVTYGEDASLPEEEVRRRLPEHYAAILPSRDPYEIVAVSPYRVHERCAPTFRQGRVLLAGDAAHVCNPCGGMGLTTGVIDAMALTQVLSAVIHGRAPESVLDFYARERRRVYLEVSTVVATEFKRRLSEKDPERRKQDEEMFRRTVTDPQAAAGASMLTVAIQGQPMPV